MLVKSETTGAEPIGDAKPLDDSGAFISRKKYAASLGICPRSAARREIEDPDFPPVFYINGRAFITNGDLTAYRGTLMRRGLGRAEAVAAESAKLRGLRGRRQAKKNAPLECEGA
jgi:hypothetical protein